MRRDVVFYMPTATPLLLDGVQATAGGAENQVLMLARALVRRGHRVGIIAHDDPVGLRSQVDGVDVIAQPMPRLRVPIVRTIVLYQRTASALRANPARVVVQRNAGIYTVLAAVTARALRRRFVYWAASVLDFDLGRHEPRRWIVRVFELGVRLADDVVVQTLEQVWLCRERFGREPLLIKEIGEPAERRAADPEAFLWIGTLVGFKRPLAYVELARAVPEAHFRMVAVRLPGAESAGLAVQVGDAARELPNLELLAPRPRAQLAPLLERAVAVVNTSRFEGMPNVFLEAWSRGVPALALGHDPDGVIERERLGFYAGGSPARLSELARTMWQTRSDQDQLAARCQEYVTREHSPEQVVDRWVEALRQAGRADARD